MATIYSLICFGGKDGKTVTFTDVGDIVNLTNHGLRDATEIVFTDNGNTLPTGLSKNTTYWAKSTASGTFTLYNSSALTTQVTFTGTGTGTHKVKSRYYYDLSDKSRWTVGGVELIYDSLSAWITNRSSIASSFDVENCEIGMAWNEIYSTTLAYSTLAAEAYVYPINDAGHGGSLTGGYCLQSANANNAVSALSISGYCSLVGIRIYITGIGSGVGCGAPFAILDRCIVYSDSGGTLNYGVRAAGAVTRITNNLVYGFKYGINQNSGTTGYSIVANNTFTKNDIGFYTSLTVNVFLTVWNNISVGNTTTNWAALPTGTISGGNAGESTKGTPWVTAPNTSVTMTTGDFANYASNIFSPAAITSPQVETAIAYYDAPVLDLIDATRPAYPGSLYNTAVTAGSFVAGLSYTIVTVGTTDYTLIGASANTIGITFKATGVGTGTGTATLNAKYDIGAYEFDLGYGTWPTSRTIDFSGLVLGSQVVIYTTATTTELARNNSTGTTYSYDAAATGVTVDYTILKTGYAPIRVTGVALSATSTPVVVQQDLDRAYSAPSGLTFGTNVIVNVTARVVTSLQVTTTTTVQNWYSYLMDSWIASATNTTLKNVAFPVIPFGEASFTTINGIEFSDGATSISKFKRDGFRYSSDAGVTATAIWAAILTLNTPAGQQVKYRQATAGSIVSAANTGPMDQLVQVYGDAAHGNYDYRGHMVLRAPKVGWSQPKPDLVATYGNLVDGLFVAALEPLLQYATTDADIDAANLVLNNTTKTYTITAAHTMEELYQRAQWWANQDAQWDADIPLTTTNGGTFTQPSNWSMAGVANLTGGTLAGGTATLAAGTQGIAYNGVTLNLGAAATYTFTADTCLVKVTPTAPSTYVFGSGSFNGTLTVNNMAAHAITIEIPAGVTTSTIGNTGGAITFSAPAIYQSVTVSGFSTTSRLQIYDTTSSTELYNGVPGATSYVWTDLVAAVATRAIRVRIADVVGATAKAFIESNIGTCAVSGSGKDISYLASQSNDTTYNSNAINGPAVYATSGITFTDAATDLVNCNIAGGSVTWPTIYACFVYWNFTAAGIVNDFTYVSAPDTANYLLSGMKIRNTSVTDLMVIGGYGRDATSGLSKDIIDTAGSTGNIFLAPDHVVPYQTTGTYAITGDISTVIAAIPSTSEIWAEPKALTVGKFLGLK
jgi:hypothetical protein